MDAPLLVTKLHAPRRRTDLVTRRRLLARLDAGLEEGRRLTLISAPAGYGKTTLVSSWITNSQKAIANPQSKISNRVAWLSLDEGDNDPRRFLEYLIAALQSVEPEYGASARALLGGAQSAGGAALLTLLLNDLAQATSPVVLVLDDYHRIHSPAVHELLDFLLEHAPRALHLALLTREDPPLALSRLRVRGEMTELRAADLRFTLEETASFLRETLGIDLGEGSVAALAARTEGWIASLQLAGMALRDQKDRAAFLEQFGGSHRYVIDYLLEEVLRRQPPEVREFLTRTSVLERFCAPLCDALLEPEGAGKAPPAEEILRELEQANLFLVPLDDTRTWYRYHHLFADALRSGLTPERARALHGRAAAWFAEAGFEREAIEHALAARDFARAAGWIRDAAGGLVRHGQVTTLLGWLDALPRVVLDEHPDLLTAKALGLLLTGQLDAVEAVLAELDERGVTDRPTVEGRALTLRAWLADARGEPRVPETAERALELLPEDATLFRILALISLSHARTAAGDTAASTQALRDAYALASEDDQPFAALGALANLAFNLLEQGERREALALCEEALARYVDARGRPLPVLGLVYLPLATAHYLGDDLEGAEGYAHEGLTICRQLFSDTMAGGDAERVLAQVHFARGEAEKALHLLEGARRAAEEHGVAQVALTFASAEAVLRVRLGEVDAVERWLGSLGRPLPPAARPAHLAWLLASRRWDEAEPLLEERAQQLAKSGRSGRLIFVRLMQAQAAAAQGQRGAALQHLESAVERAAPEGYRRPFLDAPLEVRMLLPHLHTSDADFVADLIARSDLQVPPPPEEPAELPPEYALDPLSERELEVLGLIAAGLSNREIAERLYITVGTVKRHAHNLYGKLGAGNRTQAAARARELGIL